MKVEVILLGKEPQTSEVWVQGEGNMEWTLEEAHHQLLLNYYHCQPTSFVTSYQNKNWSNYAYYLLCL